MPIDTMQFGQGIHEGMVLVIIVDSVDSESRFFCVCFRV